MAFSYATLIGPALRYLGNGVSFLTSKLERHYWAYKLLKKLKVESKKDDFATLYVATVYNLINENGKSRDVIRLFEIEEVSKAFQKELYEKNNWSFRLAFDDHLHTNPAFRKLKTIQIDIDAELAAFRDEFIKLINKGRLPKELESDQKISALLEGYEGLQAGVDQIKTILGGVELEEQAKFSGSEAVPLVQHLSKRAKPVQDIYSLFEKRETIYLMGSISTGKTQISVLVFNQHAGQKIWLSLKDSNSNNFLEKVTQVWDNAKGEPGNSWLLMVLDDLPRLDKTNQNVGAFASLILQSKKKNIKVLVTSNFNLPSTVRDLIGYSA